MAAARKTDVPQILWQDERVLVVDKPPRLQLTRDRESQPCVADFVEVPPEAALKVGWGLHDDAGGVAVFALSVDDRNTLRTQFAEGRATATVLALVRGFVRQEEGVIDLPLRFDARRQTSEIRRSRGHRAVTRFRVLERVAGSTLLECTPETYHRDQIRVHLAGVGHPLTIDPDLGGGQSVYLSHFKPSYRPNKRRPERPLLDRLSLHALRVRFQHPETGDVLTFEAPPSKDFRAAVQQLGRLR